jgi:type II secretion system protein N
VKRRTLLYIVVGTGVVLLLFPFLTILFVPAAEISGALARGLKKEGYVFLADDFSKTIPLGLKARNVLVSDERGTLLKLDQAAIRLKLLPLFLGRAVVAFRAEIGAGEVLADFEPRPKSLSFLVEKLRLEDVPLLRAATGANFKGELFLEGSFRGRGDKARGDMKLEVRQAELTGVRIGDFPLPDASYETVRGMFRAEGGKGTLESLAFQGDGIYIRLKGTLPVSGPLGQAPLNLTLELMPKPVFFEQRKLVFLVLSKYQASPGAYRIPVGGTLLKPSIQ